MVKMLMMVILRGEGLEKQQRSNYSQILNWESMKGSELPTLPEILKHRIFWTHT